MVTLGKLFGRSPFGPLMEHMKIVKTCVEKIIPFFEAAEKKDKEGLEKIAKEVFDLEGQADDIKNSLRDHLPKSLFMPVDRANLLEILDLQDSIADVTQDITIAFSLKDLYIPETIVDDLRAFVDSSVKVCFLTTEIVEKLDELLDVSFTGPEADKVLGFVSEVNNLERENDEAGINLSRKLFRMEEELSCLEIFLWLKVIDLIGDLADYAQKMANRIRLMVAKA
ncbi:MAG: TIGR00153 family protein [bacterium]|nr:TIGR00153 family protein [bacterium]